MNESVIEAVGVSKVFRDFWMREKVTAVNNLDLDVRPKEVFGLLGPNGSGKSTTLKMILGLLFPTRGRIRIFGRLPSDVQVKSRIGFLPEESYLYPFLDAHETLDYYARLFRQGRQQRKQRIEMLLDMVGLTSVAYRRVGEYSKGMQRRIGLAQALINDPDLLILDEPTSGMDPIGTRQFKDLIRTLASRGKTIVLSSHLLADVEDVCDRVCILYGGRIRAMGAVDDLLVQEGTMQLTTDPLDGPTIDQVQDLLLSRGLELRGVSKTRSRLEDLFLKIVKEAQEQRLATGGAVAGGQVAEFLRGETEPQGQKVIEELVQAARVEPEPQPQAPAPLPVEPAKEVLRELVEPATPPPASQAKDAAPAEPAQQADRSVLDSLLDKEAKESS